MAVLSLFHLSCLFFLVRNLWRLRGLVGRRLNVHESQYDFQVRLYQRPEFNFVPSALIKAIVRVSRRQFPVNSRYVVVCHVAIILANGRAAFHSCRTRQLIVTTVAMFRFVSNNASYFKGRLVPRAGTRSELITRTRHLTSVLCHLVTDVQVAQAIQGGRSIVLRPYGIVIPESASRFRVPFRWTASGVYLCAAVRRRRFFLAYAFVMAGRFLAQCFVCVVSAYVRYFKRVTKFVVGCSFPRRCPVFTGGFNRFANVSTYGTQRLLALRPINRAFFHVPIAMFFAMVACGGHFNVSAFAFRGDDRTVKFSDGKECPMIASRQVDWNRRLPHV